MAQTKRYYWLKLQDGFFNSKRIKKLRKLAGGDTYTIIYLKMQLLAMKTDGILRWTGLEDDFASELALDLDEEPQNVEVTLQYLLSCGLAETDDNVAFFLPWAVENTGSETASTIRSRESRARQKALHCNTSATQLQQKCNVEKEKEIDKEKEIEYDAAPADEYWQQDRFEEFWKEYPRKSGDIREAYFQYLGAVQNGAGEEEIISAVKAQKSVKEAQYFPAAEKWLRNKGWTEAVEASKQKAPLNASCKGTQVSAVDIQSAEEFARSMGCEI